MPVDDYVVASGVRVHDNESGRLYHNVGELFVDHASIRGIDSHLWAVLKICADQLEYRIRLSSIDTGLHVRNSRHYQGRAADIWFVAPAGGEVGPNGGLGKGKANTNNPYANRLVAYLLDHGFHAGERHGRVSVPGILFGPVGTRWNPSRVNHDDHLHVSVVQRRRKG